MSIATLLYSQLVGTSGVTALVGTRVYPVTLPQTPVLPAISYQRVSNTEQNGTSTLRTTRYQVDCWAVSYSAVQGLAAAVKTALEEWTSGSSVKMTEVINEIDDYEPDSGLYRVSIDMYCTTNGD